MRRRDLTPFPPDDDDWIGGKVLAAIVIAVAIVSIVYSVAS